jgi:chaperone required for assembly of F1-ATPase
MSRGELDIDHPNSNACRLAHSFAFFANEWAWGLCTKMVYNGAMPVTKHVRRSVSLPAPIAKQVDRMAKRQRLSDNRVLVELIELGIEARKQKEKAFFELAERFRSANDPDKAKQLGDQLGHLVFGE